MDSKTLKCCKCGGQKTVEEFSRRDVEKKCGVLRIKKGRGPKIACNICGNTSNKSKQIQAEHSEKLAREYQEQWDVIDDTFEAHCKMLGEGGCTPWFGSGKESKGRSFTDRREVLWDEIIEKSGQYRREMKERNPERYKDQMRDRVTGMQDRMLGGSGWIGSPGPRYALSPPRMEHGFYGMK